MKLSQGEYVALEKIENIYSTCSLVAQILVHGDSLQPYVVGVLVPDPVQLVSRAQRILGKTVREDDIAALQELCNDPKIVQAALAELRDEGKKHLKGSAFPTIVITRRRY